MSTPDTGANALFPRATFPNSRTPRVRTELHPSRPMRWIPTALFVALASTLPSAADAAEGLEITPSGFAEAFAQHGFAALLPQHMPVFWTLILLFGVLSILLNRFAITPLIQVIDERDRRIAGARERAGNLAEEAEQLVSRHEAALREVRDRAQTERQGLLEDARGRAQSQLDGARQEAESATQTARADVNESLERARNTLRGEADDVAEVIATRLLGGSAS